MKLYSTVLAAAALIGLTGAAFAGPVTGQISLLGYAQSNTGSMGTATGINFANAAGSSVSGSGGALTGFGAVSGTFAALGVCSSTSVGCGAIQNITSFASEPATTGFLTLTGGSTQGATAVSFDLTSITSVGHGTSLNGGSVTFTANGFINFTGFDRTAGTFILTAQGNNIVSFSATTLAAAVPEPASMALLGGSLAAIGLIRRRKTA